MVTISARALLRRKDRTLMLKLNKLPNLSPYVVSNHFIIFLERTRMHFKILLNLLAFVRIFSFLQMKREPPMEA